MSTGAALLVYTNNYLHDFSAAVFLANAVLTYWVGRALTERDDVGTREAFVRIYRKSLVITGISGGGIVVGGVIRALAYVRYEWAPAAGSGQITVLLVKHVVFALTVVAALYLQLGPVRAMLREPRGR